jgi:hypothetical protein
MEGDLVGELGPVGSKADDAEHVSARDADDDSDVSVGDLASTWGRDEDVGNEPHDQEEVDSEYSVVVV